MELLISILTSEPVIVFAKSLLLLVCLLVLTAYILYADRKIFADYQCFEQPGTGRDQKRGSRDVH